MLSTSTPNHASPAIPTPPAPAGHAAPADTLTILIADDHQLLRDGLRSLLSAAPGFEVVADAADGREAVEKCSNLRPRIVLMDVSMPQVDGVAATRQIVERVPGCAVIALSMHGDKQFVADMFRAGARGYVLKDRAFEEVLGAARAVADGDVYLSPGVANALVSGQDAGQGSAGTPTPAAALTPREREVLGRLAAGRATKEVAADLGISAKTVETHRRAIMDKLDLHSVAELTKYAIREGLTSLH
jgi:DNA-binding NarL/FixJ family response regulator